MLHIGSWCRQVGRFGSQRRDLAMRRTWLFRRQSLISRDLAVVPVMRTLPPVAVRYGLEVAYRCIAPGWLLRVLAVWKLGNFAKIGSFARFLKFRT